MAYTITPQCIGCDRCQSLCPTGAIQTIDGVHHINPDRCNNCTGFYTVPQCWSACPTNAGCISVGVAATPGDYWDTWFNQYNHRVARLRTARQAPYWQQWFNAYSQKLSAMIQSHTHQPSGAIA